MSRGDAVEAVVVGSGPNGVAAAIELVREGWSVRVYEANDTVGGGTRSAELTLPGFVHDVCSAVHPMALASPFFRSIPLDGGGVEFVQPPACLAHPFDDGSAVLLRRSVGSTAETLDRSDARAYRSLMGPLVESWPDLEPNVLGPLRLPASPVKLGRFGLLALRSAEGLARARFNGSRGQALIGGIGAHSILPLDRSPSAGVALVLGLLAHVVGWPVVAGGSQRIADVLSAHLRSRGGEILTGHRVTSIAELPPARAYLFDVTPRQLVAICGDRFPARYRDRLSRYRYGPGVYKVDWALDGPVPWKAEACSRAGTVHLGGRLEEIAASEAAVWRGEHPERPFVLLAQPSLFDPSRAPEGRHTLWGYCHVPNGSTLDMTERIEAQVERFAPGFRDRILGRSVMSPAEVQRHNANNVGGDIGGGVQDLRQLFTRPVPRVNPYTTPAADVYLCSSSTPPGGGVHGMCGHHAARTVLRRVSAHRRSG
jgi:phytoene dehydrogenase-like protein